MAYDVFAAEEEKLKNLAATIIAHKIKSVLITGESGSGKEHAAQIFHKVCGQHKPFITLNCASLNNEIYESSLFGHQRGSYTGADTQYIGVVEQANNGILFLARAAFKGCPDT